MKKFKKIVMGTLVTSMFLGTGISAMAYSKSYSFDISAQVEGSRNHSLAAKSTSTSAKGNTYWNTGAVKASKSTYKVSLVRPLKSYTTSNITANGSSYNRSFGTVTKNDYAVRVVKNSAGDYGDRVKGSGTVKQ